MVGAPLSSQWIAHKAASFTGCKLILSLSLFQNCTKHLISLPSTRWGQNWCWVCSGATRVPVDHSVALFLAAANVISSPWRERVSHQAKVKSGHMQPTNQSTNNQHPHQTYSDCVSVSASHTCASLLVNSLLTDLWISIRLMSLY